MLQALVHAASRGLVPIFGSVRVMAENCLINITALSASVCSCCIKHSSLYTSMHHATIRWLTLNTESVRCSLVHGKPCIRQRGYLASVCRTSRGRTPYKLSHTRLQWRRRQGLSCEAHQAVTVFLATFNCLTYCCAYGCRRKGMVSLGRVVAPAPVNLPSVRYAALLLHLIYAQPVPGLYAPHFTCCSDRRTMAMIQTSLWFPSKSKEFYAVVLP